MGLTSLVIFKLRVDTVVSHWLHVVDGRNAYTCVCIALIDLGIYTAWSLVFSMFYLCLV